MITDESPLHDAIKAFSSHTSVHEGLKRAIAAHKKATIAILEREYPKLSMDIVKIEGAPGVSVVISGFSTPENAENFMQKAF